ncbi:unnamed protein product [Urochloa decumbens]|uniref:Uncharacterized protein n=1 Tax=Urochloa decumbens TaxID=240449 RepID=A0ABC8XV99_9POAL
MMAIDVSFLLEFLQSFSKDNKQRALQRIPSRMSHLVDPSRMASSHSMLLRDIVMLENQVPLFLLLKALETRCSSAQLVQSVLSSMLIGFFQEVSTFRGIGRPCTDINRHAHLLDFLYSNMVPKSTEESHVDAAMEDESCHRHGHRKRTLNSVMELLVNRGSKIVSVITDFLLRFLLKFIATLPCLSILGEPIEQLTQQNASEQRGASDVQNKSTSPQLEEIAVPSVTELAYTGVRKSTLNSVMELLVNRGSKIVSVITDFLLRFLLKFIATLPCLSILGEPIEQLTQQTSEPRGASDVQNKSTSPLLEEIAVPSVTELAYTGVRFCPTVGDLSMIEFCSATATLHLPVIGVDVNSEVVLRNLVAYEAASAAGPLVLARYVELMNGIVDTEEDARLLRKSGVVLNHLKSDREVAELWNGMTRSVRLTRVPALDMVIDDLNRHHEGCWKVRVRAFVRARVLGSRELLACVAVVLLVLFLGLQAFCVLRGCVPVSYGMAIRKIGT